MPMRISRLFRRQPELKGRRLGQWIDDTRDPSPHVRIKAVAVLGTADEASSSVVPSLIHVLSDEDWLVREAAAEALANIGGDAVPALREALDHERWSVRQSAARALQKISGASARSKDEAAGFVADHRVPA